MCTALRVITALIFLTPILAVEANACRCKSGGNPPCQEYWQASSVFVGTVISSSEQIVQEEKYKSSQRLIRLTLEQTYRGIEGTEVEVVTGWGGGDCGYGFKVGESYLVYAYRSNDKKLYTSTCTRTRPLSEAAQDLAYIQGLSKAPPGSTVYGQVNQIRATAPDNERLKPVDRYCQRRERRRAETF